MRIIVVISLVLSCSTAAHAYRATTADRAYCKEQSATWLGGVNSMKYADCLNLREAEAKKNAEAAALAAAKLENEALERREAELAVKREERAKEAREQEAKREAQFEADRKETEALAVKEAAIMAGVKKRCGKDFERVRVGMSLNRAKDCSTMPLYVAGQVNRQDGVMSAYKIPIPGSYRNKYLYVMDNKIVAWETR